jgi:hypothetical protein
MGLVRYLGDGLCIQQRLFECLDSTDIRLRRTLLYRSVRNYRRFIQLLRPVTLYRSRSQYASGRASVTSEACH